MVAALAVAAAATAVADNVGGRWREERGKEACASDRARTEGREGKKWFSSPRWFVTGVDAAG
jgi:hypothetical protein